MKTDKKPEIQLLCDDALGVYIPKRFAQMIHPDAIQGMTQEDRQILLAGPDHEEYWDTWDWVMDRIVLTGLSGEKYTLWQDGNLWAIPQGMEWNESRDCWEWPFEGETFVGPECWASYLVNGDSSGLSDEEKAQADAAAAGLGSCVDAVELGYVNRPDYGMTGNCCEYRFLSNTNA